MVIARILGIFCIIFIGFGANRIGWLPLEAGRYLARIVVNIAAPCVVISVMGSQDLTGGGLHNLLLLLGVGAAQYAAVIALSFPLARLMRPRADDRGVYRNFFVFSNNGFMGFPVSLAIFGQAGMFYMVIMNCIINAYIYTVGIWNVKSDARRKSMIASANEDGTGQSAPDRLSAREMLKDVMSPLVIALIVGFVLLFLRVQLPVAVTDVLDSVGSMMAPLSMMVIGIQLTESKLGKVLVNRRLIAMALIKLIGIAAIGFLVLLPFYLTGALPPLLVAVLTLNLLLPCATVPVMFAEEYGGNVKLAAEGTFLTTLFALVTIPVSGVLLSML
jgi:predicted permease